MARRVLTIAIAAWTATSICVNGRGICWGGEYDMRLPADKFVQGYGAIESVRRLIKA